MRFRAAHFACLLLLLSALGAADASALAVGARAVAARSVAAARQSAAATHAIAAAKAGDTRTSRRQLPVAARTQQRAVWAVRPPASHSIVLQAVTGSGL